MFFSTVIRRCLLPAAAVVAEAQLTSSKPAESSSSTCRPSELPIYTPESPIKEATEDETNGLENSIKSIRESFSRFYEEVTAYEKVARQSYNESKDSVDWLITFLRKEDNTLPKAGAIGIGALTGFIFGLRGGIFKRTIYATTGALGMASVCYPKEASEYAQIGVVEGKKILTIAYNFAYGVKKDEPPLELPSLPKLPTSLSEAWDSVKSGTSSLFSDPEPALENAAGTKDTTSVSNENLKTAVLSHPQDSLESKIASAVCTPLATPAADPGES